jgi:hypothetical protein
MPTGLERCIVAIDPGASGGFCQFIGTRVVQAWKFTSLSDFVDDVHDLMGNPDCPLEIVLEDVPPFAGKNIPSSAGFKLGKSCGFYEGLARGVKIPCHLVPPKTWQKGLSGLAKTSGAQRKRLLKDHATRLFPDLGKEITLATADAVLIAHYFINKDAPVQ